MWLLAASMVLLLGVPRIRRRYLTLPLLLQFRRVMPSMPQTGKEALDAGTVWRDAELFSGRPDWNKLLNTPFIKSTGMPEPFQAADLALAAGRPLLMKLPIDAHQLDEVVLGCVAPDPGEANIARSLPARGRALVQSPG